MTSLYCSNMELNDVEDVEEFCGWASGGNMAEDFSYRSKQRALDKDERINKQKKLDVNSQYAELQHYQTSDTYRNVIRAKNLLSKDFDISEDNLRATMQRNYNLNPVEYQECLEQLANSKDVDVRVSFL
jgi:Tfp pilus assembly PilM family ATPase